MPFGLSAGAVAAIGAGVSAAGSVAGSLINSSAASSAAGKQSASSYAALVAAQQQEANGQNLANPYIGYGTAANQANYAAATNLNGQAAPYLNALTTLGSGATGQAALEQTPGYQFTLQQGLQSTQNAAAARGLGVSGAALKGAASYATGLADNTYEQQYGNAQNNLTAMLNTQNQQFNQNSSIAQPGANVLTNTNNQNLSYATGNSANITSNGNAQAASSIASGNALTSGINGVSNALTNYSNMNQLQSLLSGGSQYTLPGSGNPIPLSQAYNPLTDVGTLGV